MQKKGINWLPYQFAMQIHRVHTNVLFLYQVIKCQISKEELSNQAKHKAYKFPTHSLEPTWKAKALIIT